jgi:hypothetical protein
MIAILLMLLLSLRRVTHPKTKSRFGSGQKPADILVVFGDDKQ